MHYNETQIPILIFIGNVRLQKYGILVVVCVCGKLNNDEHIVHSMVGIVSIQTDDTAKTASAAKCVEQNKVLYRCQSALTHSVMFSHYE